MEQVGVVPAKGIEHVPRDDEAMLKLAGGVCSETSRGHDETVAVRIACNVSMNYRRDFDKDIVMRETVDPVVVQAAREVVVEQGDLVCTAIEPLCRAAGEDGVGSGRRADGGDVLVERLVIVAGTLSCLFGGGVIGGKGVEVFHEADERLVVGVFDELACDPFGAMRMTG